MSHLIDLGHKRIGFITGNLKLLSARSRLKAYEDMVAQYDLDADPELICEGDYMQLGGYDAARRILALKDRPTAIFRVKRCQCFRCTISHPRSWPFCA